MTCLGEVFCNQELFRGGGVYVCVVCVCVRVLGMDDAYLVPVLFYGRHTRSMVELLSQARIN